MIPCLIIHADIIFIILLHVVETLLCLKDSNVVIPVFKLICVCRGVRSLAREFSKCKSKSSVDSSQFPDPTALVCKSLKNWKTDTSNDTLSI